MKKPKTSKPGGSRKSRFPAGWNEQKVKDVIAYYDRQSEDEEVEEYERAMAVNGESMILVPTDLVPEIRQFIKQKRGA